VIDINVFLSRLIYDVSLVQMSEHYEEMRSYFLVPDITEAST